LLVLVLLLLLILVPLPPPSGVHPSQVDILVTNCSIFCPTPSLASMLVNHFKLRSDIQTYHLGGEPAGSQHRLQSL
jgi:hypothetical protein